MLSRTRNTQERIKKRIKKREMKKTSQSSVSLPPLLLLTSFAHFTLLLSVSVLSQYSVYTVCTVPPVLWSREGRLISWEDLSGYGRSFSLIHSFEHGNEKGDACSFFAFLLRHWQSVSSLLLFCFFFPSRKEDDDGNGILLFSFVWLKLRDDERTVQEQQHRRMH